MASYKCCAHVFVDWSRIDVSAGVCARLLGAAALALRLARFWLRKDLRAAPRGWSSRGLGCLGSGARVGQIASAARGRAGGARVVGACEGVAVVVAAVELGPIHLVASVDGRGKLM